MFSKELFPLLQMKKRATVWMVCKQSDRYWQRSVRITSPERLAKWVGLSYLSYV
ncbi:hypothetical protein DOT_2790 [Desulfosporosinus sp. OT]|nr:hypothetical protein DOT_2790 [Desulfosporosinus sp. OT]